MKSKFPVWILTVCSFVGGVLVSAFSSGVTIGNKMQVVDALCSRVEASEKTGQDNTKVIFKNTGKIATIEKTLDALQAAVETNRKENREEHMAITGTLKEILKAVK